MDENAVLQRLDRLEENLNSLQSKSGSAKPSTSKSQGFLEFLLRNWVLLSFLAALLTAIYVKFEFGVDYFRDYRSIKTKHDLSRFYLRMGDVLMGRGEWDAAEDAYRNAQQTDPDNTAATMGVVKAQVFKPPAGGKYYVPEVVDAKLNYLLSLYPADDQILFLKGVRVQDQGEENEAIRWYQKAIANNPQSLGSYVNLGFIYDGHDHFDLDLAIKNLELALEQDRDYATTHENLGYSYLLTLKYDKALEHFHQSYRISPTWMTAQSLGEAYRYSGQFRTALAWHQAAMKGIEESKSDTDPFLRGSESMWNFMPLSRQDHETIKQTVNVYDTEEKKAFTHYALSLDFAILNEFDRVERELQEALKLDKDRTFSDYVANAINAIENLCSLNNSARQWFEVHKMRFGG